MTDSPLTERSFRQGKALVRAIRWVLARFLLYAYKRRLRGVVEVAPSWVTEEILSASEHISDRRAVLWISEN